MRKFPWKDIPEFKIFKKLNTGAKIQDFLDTIPINFEVTHQTYRRPLYTLKHNEAHCMEGALLAAAILWYHGQEPLLMDFRASKEEKGDHIVALFKHNGYWGAISKTNHNVLRYRDPVYKTVRELAMSYFNEYFTKKRNKSLREYSEPFSLLQYPDTWVTDREQAWDVVCDIDDSPHFPSVPKEYIRKLRKVDNIEYKNSIPTEWPKPKRKK